MSMPRPWNCNIERALEIGGWMSAHDLEWLATTASRALFAVELGCWEGRSTRAIADNLRIGGRLYAVDAWDPALAASDTIVSHLMDGDGDAVLARFMANMEDKVKDGTVVVVRGSRNEIVVELTLANLHGLVDFVFIDADHEYDSVVNDICVLEPMLRRGGILAGHDYPRAGVRDAVAATLHVKPRTVDQIWWVQV